MNASLAIAPARSRLADDWLRQPGTNLLSGLVVALALIPESISFSVIAGVDPRQGLYASFTIAIITAFAGGRTGMISAATGSMALILAPLVRNHGVEYMLVATVCAGALQILFGVLGIGRLLRFIPRSVMAGFANALAILILIPQLHHIEGKGPAVYALAATTLAIIVVLPRFTKAVPPALVAVSVLTCVAVLVGLSAPTVGDMGELPTALPLFHVPSVPLSVETLRIIAPAALSLALVGLLESLLTAQLIDEITDTRSDKNRESRGQGIANIATGLFGGLAGCALIGQSMINMRSGGRTRLSTLASGVFLLVLVYLLADLVARIPMAVLAAVMMFFAFTTFDWSSVRPAAVRRSPLSETAVMLIVVGIVVATDNLAIGVIAGVLLSAVFLARRIAHVVHVHSTLDTAAGTRTYHVSGALFFASTSDLLHQFDFSDGAARVVIDLTHAHIWDSSAVAALDSIVAKYAAREVSATLTGLNPHSEALHAKLTGHLASSY